MVTEFAGRYNDMMVRIVDNPARSIPRALNLGIRAATGRLVIRLDAHAAPRSDYVERCVATLKRTAAANVGGVWDIQPPADTWIARAIAAAAAHPLGAGDARYRTGGPEGPVDTVPFGAFDREWLERIGPFNETLLTNEDYEYNLRLRQAGGVVWFDPSIRSTYFARGTLRELVRQYLRYGYWKGQMLKRHPSSLRWRQALPPLFVLGIVMLGVLAPFAEWARILLLLQLGLYLIATAGAGLIRAARLRDLSLAIGMPIALWSMHLSWGAAFWVGIGVGLLRTRAEFPGPDSSKSRDA